MTEFISGRRGCLADNHDLIAAGRAANRTLEQIADDLCAERDVLTTGANIGVYCWKKRIPLTGPAGRRRVLTDEQRAMVKAIPEGRAPYGTITRLAKRFGVTTVTIWKERNRP